MAMFPSSFYGVNITLMAKPDNNITTLQYRSVFLMNTDVKILNTILVNWIQQYTKRIIRNNQVGFIPKMQG